MTLTIPLDVSVLRRSFPRDTQGMSDDELDMYVRIEERAIRNQFSVIGTDGDTDAAMIDAMLAAWPSFVMQVRQIASEDMNAEGYKVTYNRAGVIDFVFPAFLGTILASVTSVEPGVQGGCATTDLVRQ